MVLGCPYTGAIDMWSFGCVAAELFLGLPLFPGASEHDLLARISATLGQPPRWMLDAAKHTDKFYRRSEAGDHGPGPAGAAGAYVLRERADFEAHNKCQVCMCTEGGGWQLCHLVMH